MGKKIKETMALNAPYGAKITASGARLIKKNEAIKKCKHCAKNFIIDQLKRGREPIYCGKSCRQRAYFKRKGIDLQQHFYGQQEQNLNGTNNDDILKRLEKLENILNDISNKNLPKIVDNLPKEKTKSKKLTEFVGDVGASALGNILAQLTMDFLECSDDKHLTVGDFKVYLKKLNDAFRYMAEIFLDTNKKVYEINARIKNRFPTAKELEAERKRFNRLF